MKYLQTYIGNKNNMNGMKYERELSEKNANRFLNQEQIKIKSASKQIFKLRTI